MELHAHHLHYREVNQWLRRCSQDGIHHVTLHGICGHRYIGTGLNNSLRIHIHGTAGNDLGAFMNGGEIVVYGNAQDGVGNTMNAGRIVVHGHAGDVVAHSMRGGTIFIRNDVGYRAGIHMKAWGDNPPLVVIGGTARDFLGEYMAGGALIVLGLHNPIAPLVGSYVGTGMHGGVIYLRGTIAPYQYGKEAGLQPLSADDWEFLQRTLASFCEIFDFNLEEVLDHTFCKLVPLSRRPYGRLYEGAVGALSVLG